MIAMRMVGKSCIKLGALLALLSLLLPLVGAQVKDAGLGWLSAFAGWVYFVGFIAFPTGLFFGVVFIVAGSILLFLKWYKT